MPDSQEFRDEYSRLGALTERFLENAFQPLPQDPSRVVAEAARYSLLAGGKRIRPILALSVGQMLGCPLANVLPFACAVEMIHTYSLIHDDLPCMDDDDLRRGRPTCHMAYGEANAVLAGDALLNLAFETLSSACLDGVETESGLPCGISGSLKAMSEIARAAGQSGMIGGQAIDLAAENGGVSDDFLEKMHRLKTGALLRAPAMAAAYLAGASSGILNAVDRFSTALGLAFQIKDDILDVTAGIAELGKTPGKDAHVGKITYVTRYGLDEAAVRLSNASGEALDALVEIERLGYDVDFLKDLIRFQLERGK
jgi:geranylgeranyl diphosphate synthase type II